MNITHFQPPCYDCPTNLKQFYWNLPGELCSFYAPSFTLTFFTLILLHTHTLSLISLLCVCTCRACVHACESMSRRERERVRYLHCWKIIMACHQKLATKTPSTHKLDFFDTMPFLPNLKTKCPDYQVLLKKNTRDGSHIFQFQRIENSISWQQEPVIFIAITSISRQ